MHTRPIAFLLAILTLLSTGLIAGDKKDSSRKKAEPYHLTVQALSGATTTDICFTVTTDDPQYPVPSSLKQLHIRVEKARGRKHHERHLSDVQLTNGSGCISFDTISPNSEIHVQAHIKTPKGVDQEVLKASAIVRLRPDLTIPSVNAPEATAPDAPFTISVQIKETKLQTGATATVSLWDGPTLLSSADGITVLAGGLVTVVFPSVHLAEIGTHTLTARISGAVPAEYDTGNNEYAFAVEVVNSVSPSGFTVSYEQTTNIYYDNTLSICGSTTTEHKEGLESSWHLEASFEQDLTAPIDSLSFEALTDRGVITKVVLHDLSPWLSDPSGDSYSIFAEDADGSIMFGDLFVDHVAGTTTLFLSKYAGDYVYVINDNGSVDVMEQHSTQSNFQGFLEIRYLLADGSYKGGGGASVTILAPESFGDSSTTFFDFGGCTYFEHTVNTWDFSSNSASGIADPTHLPSGAPILRLPQLAIELPLSADVVQNYPNPFNPSTTIQFSAAQSGPGVMKVYNMLGSEVAELFKGEVIAGRIYRVQFDGTRLASGMYYTRFETGGKQFVNRMMLVK